MEFVFVDFPSSRRVDMDGQMLGVTNRTQPCPPGHHTFDLNVPVDYSPVSQNVNVTGTTPTMPLHVLFRPAATAFIAVAAGAAARRAPAKARRKGGKKRAPAGTTKTGRKKARRKRSTSSQDK